MGNGLKLLGGIPLVVLQRSDPFRGCHGYWVKMIKYGQKNMSLEEKFYFNAFAFSYKTVLRATVSPTFNTHLRFCLNANTTLRDLLQIMGFMFRSLPDSRWSDEERTRQALLFRHTKGIRKRSCILLLYFSSVGPCEHTPRVSHFQDTVKLKEAQLFKTHLKTPVFCSIPLCFFCWCFIRISVNPRTKWSMILILSMIVWQFDHKLFQQTFWHDLSTTDWIVLLTVQGNCKTSTNTRIQMSQFFIIFLDCPTLAPL